MLVFCCALVSIYDPYVQYLVATLCSVVGRLKRKLVTLVGLTFWDNTMIRTFVGRPGQVHEVSNIMDRQARHPRGRMVLTCTREDDLSTPKMAYEVRVRFLHCICICLQLVNRVWDKRSNFAWLFFHGSLTTFKKNKNKKRTKRTYHSIQFNSTWRPQKPKIKMVSVLGRVALTFGLLSTELLRANAQYKGSALWNSLLSMWKTATLHARGSWITGHETSHCFRITFWGHSACSVFFKQWGLTSSITRFLRAWTILTCGKEGDLSNPKWRTKFAYIQYVYKDMQYVCKGRGRGCSYRFKSIRKAVERLPIYNIFTLFGNRNRQSLFFSIYNLNLYNCTPHLLALYSVLSFHGRWIFFWRWVQHVALSLLMICCSQVWITFASILFCRICVLLSRKINRLVTFVLLAARTCTFPFSSSHLPRDVASFLWYRTLHTSLCSCLISVWLLPPIWWDFCMLTCCRVTFRWWLFTVDATRVLYSITACCTVKSW